MALLLVSSFPVRLKEALNNCSSSDFANKISVSKQTISAYLTGKRKPKKPLLSTIAKELNVNEAWLLGYDTEKDRDEYLDPEYLMKIFNEGIKSSVGQAFHNLDEVINLSFLKPFLSDIEINLLHNYRSLNEEGREIVDDYVDILANSGKYIKIDSDEMDDKKNA